MPNTNKISSDMYHCCLRQYFEQLKCSTDTSKIMLCPCEICIRHRSSSRQSNHVQTCHMVCLAIFTIYKASTFPEHSMDNPKFHKIYLDMAESLNSSSSTSSLSCHEYYQRNKVLFYYFLLRNSFCLVTMLYYSWDITSIIMFLILAKCSIVNLRQRLKDNCDIRKISVSHFSNVIT